jgi:basic amino acid/polyamine antiporter, APA family
MTESAPAIRLLRTVSRWEVVALAVNDVVGSGVYLILPVATASLLGPASIWAILAIGLAILPIVLCFAEASSLFDQAGGAFIYARVAFGELIGFEIGWMSWIARVTSVAGLTVFFSRAVAYLWAPAHAGWGQWVVSLSSLIVLTAINVAGVKSGARTAVVLAVGKLVPLAMLIVVGLFAMSWSRLFPVSLPEGGKLARGALLILFAYAGFENTPAPAAEFQNPQRDIPFAMIFQIIVVSAVYALVQVVALGTVPELGSAQTPLADAGRLLMGPAGGLLLTVGAILSVLGTNNNTVLTGPRYMYALAEAGHLPSVFARVHPRFRTPSVAIIAQGILAALLLLTGTGEDLAKVSSIARIATYAGTAAAVPVLRRKLAASPRAIRLPGGIAIPIAALLVCLAFVLTAEWKNWLSASIAVAVGGAIYFSPRLRRNR